MLEAAVRQEILNGETDFVVGESIPMMHGCSSHMIGSAISGTLGLSHARAGEIDCDALWVTPWKACADGYPASLTQRGDYGELMWKDGWPSRATIYVKAVVQVARRRRSGERCMVFPLP